MNETTRHIANRIAWDLGLSATDTYAMLTSTGVGVYEEEWD